MRSLEINSFTFRLEGATKEETERCRKIIHKLFEIGFFNIKRGKAVISFDHVGSLAAFQVELTKWMSNDDTRRGTTAVEKMLESVRVTSN